MDETLAWFPVALSCDVTPGGLAGTELQGDDIVLWRARSGRLHAWLDRCPHRGMRLSLGFVREEELGCGYHGWRFGADGRCSSIPALAPTDAVPANIAVHALGCAESNGMVWVSRDSSAELPAFGEPFREGIRSIYFDAELGVVLEHMQRHVDFEWVRSKRLAVQRWQEHDIYLGVQALNPLETAIHLSCAVRTPVEVRIDVATRVQILRDLVEEAV